LTSATEAIRQVRQVQADRQQPLAIMLAGHNGSGKSTFWRRNLADELQMPLVNADRMMLAILPEQASDGALPDWAATLRDEDQSWMKVSQQGVQAFVGHAMNAKVPFAMETVFSHWQPRGDGTFESKIDQIQQMQAAGYFVLLIFVGLASVELSIGRVQTRVQENGHAVPEDKLRVANGTGPLGAYASVRLIPAEHLVGLPSTIADDTAAAAMLKGMTACYLIEECAKVRQGQPVLVHAAAGGMGSILVPWLRKVGAVVIAHAGSVEKAEQARAAGAQHVLSCPMDALASEVRDLTDGKGVEIVLDGVGKASWAASLAALARKGLMVTYGSASGAVAPFTALDLMTAGSIFVTRPTLAHYGATAEDRRSLAARVFAMIESGVAFPIGQRFSLADAATAHHALEARTTRGATVMTVS